MQAHCERCNHTVEGSYAHPRLRRLAWVYIGIAVPIIPILPMAASDYVVSLPLLMMYLLGLGHILSILREPATCNECDAFLPKPSRARA